MRTLVSLVAAVSALVILSGCSTTQSVTAGPQLKGAPLTTACFTAHGGQSADMDAAIQRNLENHGVSVSIGHTQARHFSPVQRLFFASGNIGIESPCTKCHGAGTTLVRLNVRPP